MRRLLICTVAVAAVGCAPMPHGPVYVSPEGPEVAELVAEKGSLWGAFNGKVATTAIREVDGLSFAGYRHPVKIDDKIRLLPGRHSIGVRLWGNPRHPNEGFESYVCLRLMARPGTHYVLRGAFFDVRHFRLDLLSLEGGKEKILSTLKVPVDVKPENRICTPDGPSATT